MEEKESPISGSPENTESGSPTPISGGVNSAPPETAAGNGGGVAGNGGGVAGNAVGSSKKRRGRPRKYDADGNLSVAYASRKISSSSPEMMVSPPPGFTLTAAYTAEHGSKRGRGRGSTARNLHQCPTLGGMFAETVGVDFTPYVITVQTGEDVASKINSVGQNGHKGPRGVCVLSATGAVSSVTIRQPGSSGGLLTYEGRFEILSLSGSYTMNEVNGVTSRNGGLSISLAGPDGRVVGGSVAGWLTAASPIQMVVGSFVPSSHTHKPQKRKQQRESPTAATVITFNETTPAEIPNQPSMPSIREVGPSELAPMTIQSHSAEADDVGNGHNQYIVSSHDAVEWNHGSPPSQQQKIYPDINVSVPGI